MRSITTLTLALVLILSSAASAAAQNQTVLTSFLSDRGMPNAPLLPASDGFLYGTTFSGGNYGYGSVFRIRPDGTGYETLHSFSSFDGANPMGGLIEFGGVLYGVTNSSGGTMLWGTIFRLEPGPPVAFEVLYRFDYTNSGSAPAGGLLALNSLLYGTTQFGGPGGNGTVFAFDPTTSSLSIVHAFDDSAGQYPVGTLVEADGFLYGTTEAGGLNPPGTTFPYDLGTVYRIDTLAAPPSNFEHLENVDTPRSGLLKVGTLLYGTAWQGGMNAGSIFRFDTTTDQFEEVHMFSNAAGQGFRPSGALVRAANGRLYGTTDEGGTSGDGAIYEVDLTNNSFVVATRYSFARNSTGAQPSPGLVEVGGLLYGVALRQGTNGNGTVFSFNPVSGQTAIIKAFGPSDVNQPVGALVEVGGDLIGASHQGGRGQVGTVFRWSAATSNVTVLHAFDSATEGGMPQSGVTLGSDGRLYGTTWTGGPTVCGVGCATYYGGMIFAMDSDGSNFAVLKPFEGFNGQPYAPYGRLLEIGHMLYGTLIGGGTNGGGGIFRVSRNGAIFDVLHQFDPAVDGSGPVGGLTLGSDGLLYGAASTGGRLGGGAVFRMGLDGSAFQILHEFDASSTLDGARPESELVEVRPGVFMGTTTVGGFYGAGSAGGGTVYKLDVTTSPHTYDVLRSFESCCPNAVGSNPRSALVKGAGGWLYGVTVSGGPGYNGVVYATTPGGAFRVLRTFQFAQGASPSGSPLITADGSLYGATYSGGEHWGGTLYRLHLDLDNDGVRDPIDNCPTMANATQADADGDGVGDGCPVDSTPKPPARLTLGQLQFTYDGTPHATSVATTPVEAAETGVITVTYNGSTTPPTSAGTYLVVASLANASYTTADATGILTIGRSTPVVTWNSPPPIFYPAPLSSAALNATANVPGTFTYTPAAGTVLAMGLNQVLSVEFVPTDQVNYNPVSASVTIDVRSLTAIDTTPPVVTAPGDISVLATQTAGATGTAVYYPWVGTPLPTLSGFLAGATATDDLSQPIPLPTELRHCGTNALIDAHVDATTVFPIGTNVNCVFFRFQDAAGNVGSAMAVVQVYAGTNAPAGPSQVLPAVGPTGLPTGVTVEFESGVTVGGTVGASCQRNPLTTTGADFLFDVKPAIVECGTLPDGTPRPCAVPSSAFGSSYTIACDVSTSAQYVGRVKVCFPNVYGRDTLYHYNAATGQWEDITIRPVQAGQRICGWVSSLSPFVINATPELILPSGLVVEASSAAGAAVAYAASAVDAEDGPLPADCTPVSGTVMPMGVTIVACSTADAAGSSDTASFTVTVRDTTPPVVTAPQPLTIDATQPNGTTAAASAALAQWLGAATAADLVDAAPTGGAQVAPSAIFPVGTTTVTFRFVDKGGNAGTATSTVTVVQGNPQIAVTITGRGKLTGNKQYVDLTFANIGGGTAVRATTLLIPVPIKGLGLVRIVSPGQPIAIGDLAPSRTRTIRVVLDVPTAVREFLLIEAGTFWTTSGTPMAFAETQPLKR